MLGSLYIDTISAVAYDPDGEVIESIEKPVGITIPPFTSPERSWEVEIPVSYDQIVGELDIGKVEITVTGDDSGVLTIEIKDGEKLED